VVRADEAADVRLGIACGGICLHHGDYHLPYGGALSGLVYFGTAGGGRGQKSAGPPPFGNGPASRFRYSLAFSLGYPLIRHGNLHGHFGSRILVEFCVTVHEQYVRAAGDVAEAPIVR